MMAEQIDDNQERSIRDAMQQFIDAHIEGHEPDIDEIANKYPEFKHQIRKRISNIRKINSLFANLTKADESDFADTPTGHDLIGQKVGSFEIVEMIGRAYRALGMTFLRDVEILRSGEEWNPALLKLIETADIFQLYWSEAARISGYVEQEWRHALAQGKQRFIRPLYWKKPMPEPPRELSGLHFAFYPAGEYFLRTKMMN